MLSFFYIVYKNLFFNECTECSGPVIAPKRICQSCRDAEEEAKRWKVCTTCGESFRLEDHQSAITKICSACKEEEFYWCYERTMLYFNKEFFNRIKDPEKKVTRFALKARNDIQSTTEYSEFKKLYKFENVDWKEDKTFDHINSMSYILSNFLKRCIENPKLRNYNYFRNYLLKYGVQFRTSQRQNYDLIEFQREGITPEQYLSVVGNIKGKTKEESINIIKKHFINHG